jgi:two-component system, sensor histidine kinase
VEHKIDLSGDLARSLLDGAPDPTVIVDRDGIIVFTNARTQAVFGYAPADLLGRPVEMLMPERFRSAHPAHREEFCASANSRPMGVGLELFGLHRDGHEFPVEISLSPLKTTQGLLVSSAIRDVTAQRETERALAEADRAKSRFLAAASHDLRQPLQALSLLNRALSANGESDPDIARIVERQRRAIDSMSSLLNSLLDVSKLDSGHVSAKTVDCAIDEIFGHLRSNFQEQAADKGLVLHVDQPGLGVHSDPQLLKQLLSNLLSNAIRYTQRGEVRLRAVGREDRVVIEVADTGIGIPAGDLNRVFDEFYQVERPARRPEGLGLGLAIVKRIAALLGSAVTVESDEARGTMFRISLPRASVPQRRDAPTAASMPRGSGHILIIDDEAAVADATSVLLELEGFSVQVAASEADALACAERRAPDLIISDYHLRCGTTGVDVVKQLRGRLVRRTPVVFVSGDTSGLPRSQPVGDAEYLTKPLSGEELLAAVHRGIESAVSALRSDDG